MSTTFAVGTEDVDLQSAVYLKLRSRVNQEEGY
jgi:hypothetical protein